MQRTVNAASRITGSPLFLTDIFQTFLTQAISIAGVSSRQSPSPFRKKVPSMHARSTRLSYSFIHLADNLFLHFYKFSFTIVKLKSLGCLIQQNYYSPAEEISSIQYLVQPMTQPLEISSINITFLLTFYKQIQVFTAESIT